MSIVPFRKRADRLIAASVLNMVLIVWVVLVGFDTLTHFLRQVSDIGQDGYTLANAVIELAWSLPRRLYEWFGNAALIGALLGLGGLATTGELTALRAAGMSKWRIVTSVAGALLLVTLVVMLMGETLAPYGARRAQAQVARTDAGLGITLKSGLWTRDGDRVINARSALIDRKDGHVGVRLVDVRIFTFGEGGQLQRLVHAASALGFGQKWTLVNARDSTLDGGGVHSSFSKSRPWKTSMDASVLTRSVVEPEQLSMVDLHRNMQYLTDNGQNATVYAKAFWAHVFYPLNVLVLVICALPFAFGALRSGGLGKRIFAGVIVALAWHFLQQGLVSVGIVYGLSAWLADLLPAVTLAIIATLYFRRFG